MTSARDPGMRAGCRRGGVVLDALADVVRDFAGECRHGDVWGHWEKGRINLMVLMMPLTREQTVLTGRWAYLAYSLFRDSRGRMRPYSIGESAAGARATIRAHARRWLFGECATEALVVLRRRRGSLGHGGAWPWPLCLRRLLARGESRGGGEGGAVVLPLKPFGSEVSPRSELGGAERAARDAHPRVGALGGGARAVSGAASVCAGATGGRKTCRQIPSIYGADRRGHPQCIRRLLAIAFARACPSHLDGAGLRPASRWVPPKTRCGHRARK